MHKKQLLAPLLTIFLTTGVFAQTSGYHLLKKIPAGKSEGSWDFATIDRAARRLYVAHENQVDVLDIERGTVIGEIPGTEGAHGIALAPGSGHGFVTNGDGGFVTVFDTSTLETITKVPAGKLPDSIVYDAGTRRVLAFNTMSRNATVIDATNNRVVGTIDLDGKPEFTVSDGKGTVFVDLVDKAVVARIDARKLAITDRWPVENCDRPTSMAIDKQSHRLFVGCRNFILAILDSTTGRKLTSLPIGDNVDTTAFDPTTRLIFSSTEDGNITVMHEDSPDKFRVVDTVPTQNGSKTMALDLESHRLFVPAGDVQKLPPANPGGKVKKRVTANTFSILVIGKN